MRQAEKLFDYPRVFKSYFNAYVLTNQENCAHVRMSSAESHFGLLDRIVRSIAGQKDRAKMNLVVWGSEERSLSCICSMRFNTERTTLCMSISIILS